MRSIATGAVVYTYADGATLLAERRPKPVWVGANALYSEAEIYADVASDRSTILYVGRLSVDKNPGLLLDAFIMALSRLESNTRLVFAGSGPLRGELATRARKAGIGERVEFVGSVWVVKDLRELYSHAICAVSPGYAGLSLTQSAGFGVPLVVADAEHHAPEISIARLPNAALFFKSGSERSLADALTSVNLRLSDDERVQLAAAIATRYSLERMANGFSDALRQRDPLVASEDVSV